MAKKQFDDDAFDENGILKDGRTVTYGMLMKDHLSPVQRAILETRQGMADATAPTQRGGCNGYAFTDAAQNKAVLQDAYDAYDKEASEAWRTPADLKQDEVKPNPKMTLDQVYAQREVEDQNAWRAK